MKKVLNALLNELITEQEKKLIKQASQIVSNVTSDDLLQPNDYPQLENHPFFRYEEGVLAGLRIAKTAIIALKKE